MKNKSKIMYILGLIIGIALIILCIYVNKEDIKSYNKPTIKAEIIDSNCTYSSSYDGNYYYDCNLSINYKVNNKLYNKDIVVERSVSDYDDIKDEVKKGDKVTIWYDKDNPDKIGEYKGGWINFILVIIAMGFLPCACLIALFFPKKKEKKKLDNNTNEVIDRSKEYEYFEDGDRECGYVSVPLFNEKIDIFRDEELPRKDALEIIDKVRNLKIDDQIMIQLIEGVTNYYNNSLTEKDFDYDNLVKELSISLETEGKDILNSLKIQSLHIYKRKNKELGFKLGFKCPWEINVYMDCFVIGDKVIYVGQQLGSGDPWYVKDKYSNSKSNFAPLYCKRIEKPKLSEKFVEDFYKDRDEYVKKLHKRG